MHEVVQLQFWRRYVTWFGADAPKTCDSVILTIAFRLVYASASVILWLKAPANETFVIKWAWVQLSSWPSVFSFQNHIESKIYVFF